jgi:hypothetical protein
MFESTHNIPVYNGRASSKQAMCTFKGMTLIMARASHGSVLMCYSPLHRWNSASLYNLHILPSVGFSVSRQLCVLSYKWNYNWYAALLSGLLSLSRLIAVARHVRLIFFTPSFILFVKLLISFVSIQREAHRSVLLCGMSQNGAG